jgi:hypothetical protein
MFRGLFPARLLSRNPPLRRSNRQNSFSCNHYRRLAFGLAGFAFAALLHKVTAVSLENSGIYPASRYIFFGLALIASRFFLFDGESFHAV